MRELIIILMLSVIQGKSGYCLEPDPDLAIFDKMFENVDVGSILKNHRLVDSYLNCFLNTGNCSHFGHEAKVYIPEVLRTRCGTCGENQKRALRNGLRLFVTLRPTDWEKFLDVYDPEREEWPHIKAFMEEESTTVKPRISESNDTETNSDK
ncbi:ejaculatory bulb-specific protein 3-like [Lycorma delicatula]|uniref:ejaculatory bulb-specific protein 3-like n=1 Tax=Lycorma delicatula TaxID=130591 RepID=UPI003F5140FD